MTERERLIELLNKMGGNVLKFPTDNFIESLADYLLSNGVIVPPCYGTYIRKKMEYSADRVTTERMAEGTYKALDYRRNS